MRVLMRTYLGTRTRWQGRSVQSGREQGSWRAGKGKGGGSWAAAKWQQLGGWGAASCGHRRRQGWGGWWWWGGGPSQGCGGCQGGAGSSVCEWESLDEM
jgi:hypothetical protein